MPSTGTGKLTASGFTVLFMAIPFVTYKSSKTESAPVLALPTVGRSSPFSMMVR